MNVVQLRTFVTVVERGSFSDAAKALEISQPAVTMQIQSLESALGTTLLDRRYRRVDLTEAGRTLLPHARAILEQLDGARNEIASLSGNVSGRLVISASTTPGDYVVPRLLGGFTAEYPEVSVCIEVHDTSEVVDAIEAGRAHLGISGAVMKGARVKSEQFGTDDLALICPPTSPLAARAKVALSSLSEEPWVQREQGSGTRQVAESVLAGSGIDPQELRVVVELGSGEAVVSAVEGGLGVAIVSRRVAEKAIALGAVAQVDAVGFPVERPLYVVLPKGTPTRAAEAFRAYLMRESR